AVMADAKQSVVGNVTDSHGVESPFMKDLENLRFFALLRDEQHSLLRFAQHDFIRGHRGLALRDLVEFNLDAGAGSSAHSAARTGETGRPHILNADDESLLHRFQTSFEKQFLHERIADLDIGSLRTRVLAKSGRSHRRAVNAVPTGFGADVYDRITN